MLGTVAFRIANSVVKEEGCQSDGLYTDTHVTQMAEKLEQNYVDTC